jgi:CHASE3 domain sensor protein
MPPQRPLGDPVREAVQRWLQRFPDTAAAVMTDPVSAQTLKILENSLVQADMAMQDEGIDFTVRRRIISAALYGSIDEEGAVARERARREAQEWLAHPTNPTPFPRGGS